MINRNFSGAAVAAFIVLCLSLIWTPAATCDQQSVQQAKELKPQFVAYYFFTNKRCRTCKTIERMAKEAIEQNFKDQIAAGRLQWIAVNVQKPENKHFIEDFKLYSKTVVIAEYKDAKPVRWVNLEKVWQLYRDKEKYFDYLSSETKAFMEKS